MSDSKAQQEHLCVEQLNEVEKSLTLCKSGSTWCFSTNGSQDSGEHVHYVSDQLMLMFNGLNGVDDNFFLIFCIFINMVLDYTIQLNIINKLGHK